MSRRATIGWIAVLVALAVASRLPQLRSPNLLVDGDEAVLGLMARHVLHGDVPVFFWGQHYGLSTFEALAGAAAFALLGTGAVPLKIAMLAIWVAGVVFLFLAFASIVGPRRSFWIAAVLVLTPAWAVWSMKARGGYLTAFAASSALLWCVAGDERDPALARWVAAGPLTAIVYLAQPIWLPAVLPIVAAALLARRGRARAALVYAAAVAVPVAVVKLATRAGADTWAGPALGNPSIWGMRERVAQQIYTTLTGSYYLGWGIDPPGPATRWLAAAWCVLLAGLVAMQAYRLATRSFCRWSHLLFACAAATIAGNWLLLFARDARYLLPLTGVLVPLVAIELDDLVDRRVIRSIVPAIVVAAALALGAESMREFAAFSFLWTNRPGSWSEARRLQQVVNAVTSRGATHVFSMNGLLDTQLIFYSDEHVVARWAELSDRHPAYVAEVNRALAAGEPVAVVGYTHTSGAPGCVDVPICTGGIENLVRNPEAIFTVDGKYFVYVGATRDLLRQLHFNFPD